MSKLISVRFSKIGHATARLDGLAYDMIGDDGSPENSMIIALNSSGKTSQLHLLFSIFLPAKHDLATHSGRRRPVVSLLFSGQRGWFCRNGVDYPRGKYEPARQSWKRRGSWEGSPSTQTVMRISSKPVFSRLSPMMKPVLITCRSLHPSCWARWKNTARR